ncbi:Peptidase S33 tripeptidyl aminopeptidase-lik [Cordyceps fumosorosea ARSEF 2679]|uniref:Peptidase S33 tripeptidyl aminopeptidase-lik n=1 Tax=Cordyceps fumosorosea (strain ARSEF 2679) TaxID=1081104 RepID=A0A167SZP1_CORFA|nr:Peptidase S33 tripeptidyl aminopeptidase-lik [Cordyceps fumosorosea ARSEF 2679]OAA60096.1 Peptidase S33 tripeptidyl aminopeptidase-lik [Cordyceps fumosorosea ARSEF 2679]
MRANILALAALAGVATAADKFDWQSITPSHDLAYHDCYGSFRCARLLLPLDWLNPKPNETIALALIKSPAVVPVDDPTYGGPVLSNPGGPGGSGVDYLRGAAAKHHDVVDTPGRRHFEFVSFDPRGIGRTTPQINCYPDSRLAQAAASLEARGSGGVDTSPAALSYNLGLAAIRGDRCEEFNGELLKYVGTTSVARDMLAVVEKIDAYNKKQRKKGNATGEETTVEADEDDDRLELRDAADGKHDLPRLQYMGFSYGTVLGNYFASMFPGRIGRLLLDGVCDIDDYATGDGWLTNTVDTDEMADVFFQSCFDAGSDACALYRHGDASGADIARRFWDWAARLDESPVFVTKPDGSGDAAVVRPADLHALLFEALYSPFGKFPETAKTADEAMRGNTTALWELVTSSSGGPLEEVCPIGGNSTAATDPDVRDPQSAILCGDGEPITGRDAAFWRGYVEHQLAQSSVAGATWSTIRIACSKWRTPAKWQFHGPFTSPAPSRDASKPEPGRPAAPILFLSNRLDPVTPLRAARKAAAKYPGAGVLVQEALGHCVLGSPRSSDCTRDVVRKYFDEGVVPDGEKTCEAACELWEKCEPVGALAVDEPSSRDWRFPLHV